MRDLLSNKNAPVAHLCTGDKSEEWTAAHACGKTETRGVAAMEKRRTERVVDRMMDQLRDRLRAAEKSKRKSGEKHAIMQAGAKTGADIRPRRENPCHITEDEARAFVRGLPEEKRIMLYALLKAALRSPEASAVLAELERQAPLPAQNQQETAEKEG